MKPIVIHVDKIQVARKSWDPKRGTMLSPYQIPDALKVSESDGVIKIEFVYSGIEEPRSEIKHDRVVFVAGAKTKRIYEIQIPVGMLTHQTSPRAKGEHLTDMLNEHATALRGLDSSAIRTAEAYQPDLERVAAF